MLTWIQNQWYSSYTVLLTIDTIVWPHPQAQTLCDLFIEGAIGENAGELPAICEATGRTLSQSAGSDQRRGIAAVFSVSKKCASGIAQQLHGSVMRDQILLCANIETGMADTGTGALAKREETTSGAQCRRSGSDIGMRAVDEVPGLFGNAIFLRIAVKCNTATTLAAIDTVRNASRVPRNSGWRSKRICCCQPLILC